MDDTFSPKSSEKCDPLKFSKYCPPRISLKLKRVYCRPSSCLVWQTSLENNKANLIITCISLTLSHCNTTCWPTLSSPLCVSSSLSVAPSPRPHQISCWSWWTIWSRAWAATETRRPSRPTLTGWPARGSSSGRNEQLGKRTRIQHIFFFCPFKFLNEPLPKSSLRPLPLPYIY